MRRTELPTGCGRGVGPTVGLLGVRSGLFHVIPVKCPPKAMRFAQCLARAEESERCEAARRKIREVIPKGPGVTSMR